MDLKDFLFQSILNWFITTVCVCQFAYSLQILQNRGQSNDFQI
jgi:hypothetical protein